MPAEVERQREKTGQSGRDMGDITAGKASASASPRAALSVSSNERGTWAALHLPEWLRSRALRSAPIPFDPIDPPALFCSALLCSGRSGPKSEKKKDQQLGLWACGQTRLRVCPRAVGGLPSIARHVHSPPCERGGPSTATEKTGPGTSWAMGGAVGYGKCRGYGQQTAHSPLDKHADVFAHTSHSHCCY
jgi:hypothetical protein